MESSGRPDQVHVSEETCSFLGDSYVIEEGEEVDGKFLFIDPYIIPQLPTVPFRRPSNVLRPRQKTGSHLFHHRWPIESGPTGR